MTQLIKFYTDTIKEKSGDFYGTWPVDSPIELGDYGKLDGNKFERYGNVKDNFCIDIIGQTGIGGVKTYSFKAGDKVNVTTNCGSSVGDSKATLEISFGGESGVYFSIDGCKYSEIKNYQQLGEKIIELYYEDKWKEDYVIVNKLVKADASTIVLTNGTGASIKLEANVPAISEKDCVNSDIKFNIVSQNNIGLNLVAENNLKPLLGLSNITTSFIYKPEWGKYGMKRKSGVKKAITYLKKACNANKPRNLSTSNMVASVSILDSEKVLYNNYLEGKYVQSQLKYKQYRRTAKHIDDIISKEGKLVGFTRNNKKQIRNKFIKNNAVIGRKLSSRSNGITCSGGNRESNRNVRLVTFQQI